MDGGDGIATAEIDPAIARARTVWGEPILRQRRPELYRELMTNTFAWNPGDFFRLYGHQPCPRGGRPRWRRRRCIRATTPQQSARDRRIARAAAGEGAELVVFPELALTGLARPSETALEADSPILIDLQSLAAELKLHLVVGFAERDGARSFNSAILVGPEGVLGVYRKIHLTEAEKSWAEPGEAWALFDLPFGRLGLLIGHDMSFPEAGRILALKGCDLIACPRRDPRPVPRRPRGHQRRAARAHPDRAGPPALAPVPGARGREQLLAGLRQCPRASRRLSRPFRRLRPRHVPVSRQETVVQGNGSYALMTVDTGSLGGPYPTHVVRRKDLVLMRQPHHYRELIAPRAT